MNYGSRLRQIRQEKGMKQDDVADRLGITQGAYSQWELGEVCIKLETLPKLAEAFGMELPELLQRLFGENLVFNNHQQKGGNFASIVINNLSEKVIELYESRIVQLEEEIASWKSQVQKNEVQKERV